MTWYPECAATPEDDGPNWTPPTVGNLMQEQQTKLTRLREAEAHQLVAREARLFHERKALKYGVHTSRGMAHFKASMGLGNTREADGRLQEMFAQGGDPSAELPPKAVMKASKAAMQFHQKQAEKHGLNTPVGQAHVAAMQHHQAIHGKAKDQHQQMQQMKMQQQQAQPRSPKVVKQPEVGNGPMDSGGPGVATHGRKQPMMASTEGGPGSGPRSRGARREGWDSSPHHERMAKKLVSQGMSDKEVFQKLRNDGASISQAAHAIEQANKGKKSEAAPGHSSKKSPVPVPKKSDQPSEDIRQNKPPIGLNPQDANKPGGLAKLRQNETMGAHAGMIRAGGPGSGRHAGGAPKQHDKILRDNGFKLRGKGWGGDQRYSNGKDHIWVSSYGHWVHEGSAHGKDAKSLSDHLSSRQKESRIRNFAREGGHGPYDNQDCTLPSKVKDQMKRDIIFRGKRTDERNKREAGSVHVSPKDQEPIPKEGYVDKRYPDMKSGVEAGWADKQRKMHRKMAKKSAPRVMESNRQRFPREKAIDLRDFYKEPAKKGSETGGWRNGTSFVPVAPKAQREEVNLFIKEF